MAARTRRSPWPGSATKVGRIPGAADVHSAGLQGARSDLDRPRRGPASRRDERDVASDLLVSLASSGRSRRATGWTSAVCNTWCRSRPAVRHRLESTRCDDPISTGGKVQTVGNLTEIKRAVGCNITHFNIARTFDVQANVMASISARSRPHRRDRGGGAASAAPGVGSRSRAGES